MKVILAGHTVDKGIIRQVAQGRIRHDSVVSPESIAAAYGRISRYPTPAPELRRITREDVASARRSNRLIVFKMGHRAVAEHVLFNFDILGISRLALEALEEARLCTCTEKSGRHIESESAFVIPAEFSETQRQLLQRVVEMQAALQSKLFNPLLEHYSRLHPDMESKRRDVEALEGWALQDAAYASGLCTQAQLGFSGNARNIEYLIRKLRHHRLAEARELGQLIFNAAASAAPSLIELSDPGKFKEAFGTDLCEDHLRLYRDTLRHRAGEVMADTPKAGEDTPNPGDGDVTLVGHTPEPDVKLAASLLAAAGPSRPYGDCLEASRSLGRQDDGRLRAFILEAMRHMSDRDPAPREFETVSFTFEIICSASCFAALQR
ncbi:MAG: FAD-dependent thymidylate synthase, partial [Pseudomonadota bacterium]